MTAAELIRSARMRAALAQHELADLLGTPRSQIARWEAGEVEPAFATVRRVLQACGFDLSMGLVPYVVTRRATPGSAELSRLTPKERLDAALARAGVEQPGNRLDPYAIVAALDERRVNYILIGSLARVLQGADEVPGSLDIVFPKGARDTADQAISSFALPAPTGVRFEGRRLGVLERRRQDQSPGDADRDEGPPRPSPTGRARPPRGRPPAPGRLTGGPRADDGGAGTARAGGAARGHAPAGGARPGA